VTPLPNAPEGKIVAGSPFIWAIVAANAIPHISSCGIGAIVHYTVHVSEASNRSSCFCAYITCDM